MCICPKEYRDFGVPGLPVYPANPAPTPNFVPEGCSTLWDHNTLIIDVLFKAKSVCASLLHIQMNCL